MSNLTATIIVPVLNGYRLLQNLCESIAAFTPAGICEIILVDNASTEPQMGLFYGSIRSTTTRVIRNTENVGFGRANNQALQHSRGEFLMLLNNDTTVTPGWLEPLRERFRTTPSCGAVQSKIVLVSDGPLDTWKTQTCGCRFSRSTHR